MISVHIVLAAVYGTAFTFGKVCSPNECLDGYSSSSLLAYDKTTETYLSPGTYLPSSPLSQTEIQTIYPSSITNATSVHVGISLVVLPPPQPLLYPEDNYAGAVGEGEWKSAYFPPGFYGLVEPGKAIWGSIPRSKELRGVSNLIKRVGLATCNPPCASGGQCIVGNGAGKCECKKGWTGASCDACAKGFYGKQCQACNEDCSVCDDGLQGSGQCLSASHTPEKACNCAHGSCTPLGECVCAAGYTTNTTDITKSDTKCSQCASGYFMDANENCLACPLGCSFCALREDTTYTPTCTACVADLSLSTADATTCVSRTSCSAGQYFDISSSSCQGCSPACDTCTGPSTAECLACASPRANLGGNCVGFDALTGVCDSALSGLQGVFVVNNAKSKCEPCPAGCISCTLPSFSSGTAYSSAICRACQDGFLLQNGKCVKTCSDGWFMPQGTTTNGTCQRCDSSCASCVGTATTCTKCSPPTFASDGSCVNLCPSSSVPSNGTCLACSPDCTTCSSPAASSCLSCPSDRPILTNGRCLEYCPKDQYFEPSSSSCRKCDKSCGACFGSSSSECATCPEGFLLKAGECQAASCKHGITPGLNLCLEDLVGGRTDKRYFGFLAVIFLLAIIALGFWLFVRRQRRKTREATQGFADAIDDKDVSDRMMILRLEKVLGFDRVRPAASQPRLAEEGERKAKEKRRLRELLLISRRKREAKGKVKEEIPLQRRKTRVVMLGTSAGVGQEDTKATFEQGSVSRDPHWFAPPPPYAYPDAKLSSSSIASSTPPTEYPPLQTKIISMSSPSSPDLVPRALCPPPRRNDSASSFGSHVKMPLGHTANEGKEVERRRNLKSLWPAMPSPVFGEAEQFDAGQRESEGWV